MCTAPPEARADSGCTPSPLGLLPQICEVLNATEMTCQAPALALGPDHQSDLTERPEEFGFILDNVQSLLILNKTNFTYYPNPVFEAFGPSGILELKPGTPIILKVGPARGGRGRCREAWDSATGNCCKSQAPAKCGDWIPCRGCFGPRPVLMGLTHPGQADPPRSLDSEGFVFAV